MSEDDGMIDVVGKRKKQQPRHSRGKLQGYKRDAKAAPRIRRQGAPQATLAISAPMAVVPTRAITDPAVSDVGFRILAAIASYSNRAGIAWPSAERIGAHVDLDEAQVWSQIKRLVDAGHVQKLGRYTIAGVAYSNTYRIVFDPSITAEDAIAAQTAADLEDAARKGVGVDQHPIKAQEDQGDVPVIQNQQELAVDLSMIEEVVSEWYEASQRWGRPRPDADLTRAAARVLVTQGATAQSVRVRLQWLWENRRPLPVSLAGLRATDLKG